MVRGCPCLYSNTRVGALAVAHQLPQQAGVADRLFVQNIALLFGVIWLDNQAAS